MRWPYVWRKTAEVDVAMWKTLAGERLKRAEQAEKRAETEASAKRTIAELYAELCDSHGLPVPVDPDHPDGRQAARVMAAFDEAQARKAAERIAQLVDEGNRARAEARAEKKRADGLQQRLDDAVGLTPKGIQDSAPWQPGYEQPTPDTKASTS
jgi:hypothetical protein